MQILAAVHVLSPFECVESIEIVRVLHTDYPTPVGTVVAGKRLRLQNNGFHLPVPTRHPSLDVQVL